MATFDAAVGVELDPPFDPSVDTTHYLLASYIIPCVELVGYVGAGPELSNTTYRSVRTSISSASMNLFSSFALIRHMNSKYLSSGIVGCFAFGCGGWTGRGDASITILLQTNMPLKLFTTIYVVSQTTSMIRENPCGKRKQPAMVTTGSFYNTTNEKATMCAEARFSMLSSRVWTLLTPSQLKAPPPSLKKYH